MRLNVRERLITVIINTQCVAFGKKHARTRGHTHTPPCWGVLAIRMCVKLCVISVFRHEVPEDCAPLGYYAANRGNFLPTFRDNLSAPSSGYVLDSWTLRIGQIGWPETSVRNYPYLPRNDPEERSSEYAKMLVWKCRLTVKVNVNHFHA